VIRGGIVVVDPDSGVVRRVIALQYNPDTLTRSLQPQAAGEGGDRSEAMRLKAPPIETIKLDAEVDAADQLEFPDRNPVTLDAGILPLLAALETIVYPESARIQSNLGLASAGLLEIAPLEAPLTLFVWSRHRIVPVRLTEFSITEEFFDPLLNPIRARISLGMRVLSVHDLGPNHRGTSIYLGYQQQKERLAARYTGAALGDLGIRGIS
jgi:hypothetical protein